MKIGRRTFVAAGVTAAQGTAAAPHGRAADQSPPLIDDLPVLDYGRSFVCGTADFNNVRFWVESRTVLIDGAERHEFLQCGSCKSENTFAQQDLFHADNYDFLPILGDDEQWLIFRRRNRITPDYRTIKQEVWGPAVRKLKFGQKVRGLESFAAIRDATAAGTPLVSRTILSNDETGMTAVIEAPVKTINIEPHRKLYQVDTGPVALPDLSRRYEPAIDCLRLAFVAFNAPQFADFVIEQPTPVLEDGQERAQVFHFSRPISLPARNLLIALEDA
ncbi:MAG: hypothetical protein KY476_03620 [Planctomycetes bacterium]|nr:hypothetical protein [Planctomycetota bacterium]